MFFRLKCVFCNWYSVSKPLSIYSAGTLRRLVFAKRYSTIYALSSGFGKCGVAVIRVSGSQTQDIALKVAGFKKLPEPRKAYLRGFRDPVTDQILDHGLFLYFAGPKSFTGEDCCELQVHGGSAVISSVLSALGKISGCRPAEAGEFTKRAFYAGKFDLTEVEGLADLINAETEAQRHQALLQMEGVLNKKYTEWRTMLLHSLARVEAIIDFSEEDNIEMTEYNILKEVNMTIKNLDSSIKKHVNDGRKGERTRNGVKTVIVGAPNVGKSSLLNALSQQQAAIVSPIPGTTRDIVKLSLDIGGFPVTLLDTAGLRSKTDDIIEQEGISRARISAADADLILIVLDSNQFLSFKLNNCKYDNKRSHEFFEEYMKNYISTLGIQDVIMSCQNIKTQLPFFFKDDSSAVELMDEDDYRHCLILFNKIDILGSNEEIEKICERYKNVTINISCKTETGFDKLLDKLTDSLKTLCGNSTKENPNLSQARHRYHLLACLSALDRYLSISENEKNCQIDIAAEQIRIAAIELGKVTGNISAEDVLDVIFKQFCIGK